MKIAVALAGAVGAVCLLVLVLRPQIFSLLSAGRVSVGAEVIVAFSCFAVIQAANQALGTS